MTEPSSAAAAAVSAFDVLSIDDDPRQMTITNPKTGDDLLCKDGKPAFVMVHSINSKVGDRVVKSAYDRANKEGRNRGKVTLDYDDMRAIARANTALLIAGWRLVNPATREVIDFPYSAKNAADLMNSPNREWLRRQIDEFAADDANFMKG